MTTPIERLVARLPSAKRDGRGWMARCPAHDDRRPSLSIDEGEDGRVLVYCFVGCPPEAIVGAIGLTLRDLMPDAGEAGTGVGRRARHGESGKAPRSYPTAAAALAVLDRLMAREKARPAGSWTYEDTNGAPIALVVRYDLSTADGRKPDKTFRPISRHEDGWRIADPPGKWPLYRLPALAGGERVWIGEGEKVADSARSIGFVATTSAHGSKSARKTDWTPLAGGDHVVLPDADDTGRRYAEDIAGLLTALHPPATVRIVELPGLPPGGDIVDFIEARRAKGRTDDQTRAEIEQFAAAAEPIEGLTIRAGLKGGGLAGIEFRPIPASELGPGDAVEWVWEGYVGRAYTTLLVGLWKAGKTTLLAHLLHAAGEGGDVGGRVHPATCLVVTEEGSGLWARRRDEIGIGDHVHFIVRPFKCRPSRSAWEVFISNIAKAVAAGCYSVVAFDSWQSLNPCPDENDASRMMEALLPLQAIAEAGAAVLVLHHPRKGDGGEAQASRGSGAMPGFVDVILELRRYDAKAVTDPRRVLRAYSRFDETPAETVIELRDDGYHCIGSRADAKREDRWEVIAGLLSDAPKTVEEALALWPDGGCPRPGLRTLRGDLLAGAAHQHWDRIGRGKKGDPYRFLSCKVPALRDAGNEGAPTGAGPSAHSPHDGSAAAPETGAIPADSPPTRTGPTADAAGAPADLGPGAATAAANVAWTAAERELLAGSPPATWAAVEVAKAAFAGVDELTVFEVVPFKSEARDAAARIIREARRRDGLRARDLLDAWEERVAICTVDGDLSIRDAEAVALNELGSSLAERQGSRYDDVHGPTAGRNPRCDRGERQDAIPHRPGKRDRGKRVVAADER